MTITITPTQLLAQQVRLQKQLDLKSLFTATDNSGTVDHYKITTSVGFGGTIGDATSGSSISGASQTLIVSAADVLNYVAQNAVGAESFTIQASDDGGAIYGNAVTISENVVKNTAPTVMAVPNPASSIIINKTYGAAQLFQASDVNFDAIQSYTITTPASGGGTFTLGNGAHTTDGSNTTGALAANTTYTISGADLANLTFTTGATAGSTSFKVAASDGVAAGAATAISLSVQTLGTPTVSTPTPTKPILLGSTTAASSLIQASDPDGTAISGYSIHVGSSNSGFFTLNGTSAVATDASGNFFVSASDFASLQYKANATATGTDNFTVTAVAQPNGTSVFSAVANLAVTVTSTAPVVVKATAAAASVTAGTTINASTLFTATDPKGNPVKGYSIIPSQAGQFLLNGTALAANSATFVNATDLPLLQYVAGPTAGTATFQIAASDGNSLGAFSTINVTSAAGTPTITAATKTPQIEPNVPVAASSLFTGSEAGGTIQGYSLVVPSSLGHMVLNGQALATDQPIFVTAADFANLTFVATAAPGSATLQAAAYDGKTFSAYSNVPVNVVGPTVTQASTLGTNSLTTNGVYAASKLFSLTPVTGGTPITGFSIQTPPASEGVFYNGTTALPSNQPVFLNATDLANITLHTSGTAGPLTFQVSAFDGTAFGQPKLFSLNSVANSAPTVNPASGNIQATTGNTVLASTLFRATDPNGDAITAYQITEGSGPGAGVFSGSGLTFVPGVPTTVTAAQLASLKYTAGGPNPAITLSGNINNIGSGISPISGTYSFVTSDGATYGATLQLNFTDSTHAELQIASLTPSTGAPAVTASTPINLGAVTFDSSGNATDFIAAATAEPVSGSGSLLLSDDTLDFSHLTATSSATNVSTGVSLFQTGTSSFTVAATDDPNGVDFSQSTAATIKVQAVIDQPPTVVALPQSLPVLSGDSIAATSLFSATDSDGGTVQAYSIVPPSSSVGTFSGFTSQDPVTGVIYVSAADLANLKFTAGSQGLSGKIQVAAFDGTRWSNATSVSVATSQPQPPAITLTPPTVLRPNATIAATSLLSAKDPRGGTIQAYSISTPPNSNGYFTLNGVRLPDNTQNYITSAQLANLVYVGGPVSTPATFSVSAFNGTQWSSYSNEQVNVSSYRPPVVKAPVSTTPQSVVAGGSFAVSSLIGSVTTDSNAPVQKYIVSASAGSFTLNGQTVDAKTPFTVNASDLANLKFVAPATLGNVTVNIAANDGTQTGPSVAETLAVTTNAGPTITQTDVVQSMLPGQTYQASTLFNATDPSGLPITGYFVTAQTGDGRFQLKNADGTVTTIPQGTKQFVSISQLANLQYVTGSSSVTKGAVQPTGTIIPLDTTNQGSGYTKATVTLPAPPAGGTQATATANISNGKVVSITITNPGSGYTAPLIATLSGDGTGATGPVVALSQPSSTFTVSAADSVTEGAAITEIVNPIANIKTTTVVPAQKPTVAVGGNVSVASLFSAIGANGIAIQAYNLSADVGTFTLNGTALTTGQLSFITPDVFANLFYQASNVPGTATIQAVAQDANGNWSAPVKFPVTVS